MSWMTSSGAGAGAGAAVDGPGTADGTAEGTGSAPDMAALLLRSEDLGEVVAAALHPDQSDAEVGRAVLHRVQHPLPGKLDGEGVRPAVVGHLCPGRAQPRGCARPGHRWPTTAGRTPSPSSLPGSGCWTRCRTARPTSASDWSGCSAAATTSPRSSDRSR